MLLLQLEPTAYLLISIASLLSALFLARWIFAIDAFLKQQRIQTQLLKEIATKNGIGAEVLKDIFEGWESEPKKANEVQPDKDGWITP